jgi:hypothetical protein
VAYPIETMYRTVRDCETMIYFTDGFNPYRSVNLSNLDKYKDPDGNWICELFDFSPDLTVPIIDSDLVADTGGQLKIGAYQFSIRYIDDLNNATNWFYVTRPIIIYDERQSDNFHFIDGGYNQIINPEESGSVLPSTKTIELKISRIDQNFDKFQIGVLASLAGSGTVSEAYILPAVQITDVEHVYTVQSVTPDVGAIKTVPDEFLIDPINVYIAKTHAQIDSRHILGNLEFKVDDNLRLQRIANNIKVK